MPPMATTYLADPDTTGMSSRAAAKALRRVELLRASAKIMAEKGFHAMRLEDLGEAVGVSGPAVYRHFSGKEEILTELMTGISEHLFEEAQQILGGISDPRERLEILIDFHTSFALEQSELIRLHNRELFRMGEDGHSRVRAAQGHYLGLWADALEEMGAPYAGDGAKITAQLVIGLINAAEYLNARVGTALLRRQVVLSARSALGLR